MSTIVPATLTRPGPCPSPRRESYSSYSHSAVFAEVHVDQDLGTIHVTRVVSAVAGAPS